MGADINKRLILSLGCHNVIFKISELLNDL